MQTGKDGGAPSAADGPDVEEVLARALAEMDELLASVALEPPCTPARSATAARQSGPRIHGDAPASPATNSLAAAPSSARRAGDPGSAVGSERGTPVGSCVDGHERQLLLTDSPHCVSYASGPMTPVRAAPACNYTTTVDSPRVGGPGGQLVHAAEQGGEEERLQHMHMPATTEEGRDSPGLAVGGESDADGPSEVLSYEEEAREELDRARARVAELEQRLNPQALVDEDQLRWAAAVAQVELDEREERRIEQGRVDEYRRHLELERVKNRLKAMTESARTGRTVTIYFGDGRAPLPVDGPRWLAEEPPYGTAEAKAWEHRRRSLMASETEKVRREMEEEDRQAQAAAELSDATGSESSDSDRDTYFNPDSSQALPVDPEWSRSQALFEDAVGDGTYFADPNCEWEEEVEETKHGGS